METESLVSLSVNIVSYNGNAETLGVRCVDPELVGPSGLGIKTDPGSFSLFLVSLVVVVVVCLLVRIRIRVRLFFHDFVVSNRGFSLRPPFYFLHGAVEVIPGQWQIDCALLTAAAPSRPTQFPFKQCRIPLLDGPLYELCLQPLVRLGILGGQEQSRGGIIQPVNQQRPFCPWIALLEFRFDRVRNLSSRDAQHIVRLVDYH
mmetsp:Transcript_25490/g.55841  ORF Transcript_25490/g.55841 Transcript_25490/m.55841 type:complete len:203 (-) Transcript_25490:215-823(-)